MANMSLCFEWFCGADKTLTTGKWKKHQVRFSWILMWFKQNFRCDSMLIIYFTDDEQQIKHISSIQIV